LSQDIFKCDQFFKVLDLVNVPVTKSEGYLLKSPTYFHVTIN